MYKYKSRFPIVFLMLIFIACKNSNNYQPGSSVDSIVKGGYAYDFDFLKKHTRKVIELTGEDSNAKILLSADYQGRVMTSTATGDMGTSYGWINYDLIASGKKKDQFNPVGGEERFWIGPEGGQYSVYFKAGDSFNINHWQVPAVIDTIAYDVVRVEKAQALFSKKASLVNYSGTAFDITIDRKISLLDKNTIESRLKSSIPANVHFVGYETDNQIINSGNNDWTKEKGLLSVWLLGMFTPTPQTTVVIPFQSQKDARSYITTDYFGEIPPERLLVKDSVLFFTCDGKFRSKIGLSPAIAKPIAGSFDFKNNALTIIIPEIHKNSLYVNSKWEIQKEPYKGDVVNSYNDGPLKDGSQLGPFYEIESSSPAKELKKGEKLEYRQVTCHFQGDYGTLRKIMKQLLGVDPDELKKGD
jgi:hypothetical protein